jgi:hypothetical protein
LEELDESESLSEDESLLLDESDRLFALVFLNLRVFSAIMSSIVLGTDEDESSLPSEESCFDVLESFSPLDFFLEPRLVLATCKLDFSEPRCDDTDGDSSSFELTEDCDEFEESSLPWEESCFDVLESFSPLDFFLEPRLVFEPCKLDFLEPRRLEIFEPLCDDSDGPASRSSSISNVFIEAGFGLKRFLKM